MSLTIVAFEQIALDARILKFSLLQFCRFLQEIACFALQQYPIPSQQTSEPLKRLHMLTLINKGDRVMICLEQPSHG
jgi:hypothetical protein